MDVTPETILDFWFPAQPYSPEALATAGKLWFESTADQDEFVRLTFGHHLNQARGGDLDHWKTTSNGRLALILILDQFTRCVHRGTPQAFSGDRAALNLAMTGIEQGLDTPLNVLQRQFFYMPFQHIEDIDVQDQAVELFRQLAMKAEDDVKPLLQVAAQYALLHRDIVAEFGRFPHRNRILGRHNTVEEDDYLAADAPTFGQ